MYNKKIMKCILNQCRLINNNFYTCCMYSIHNTLNGRLTKIITTHLHSQTVNSYSTWSESEYLVGNEIFSRAISGNNSSNDIVWRILIVC